LKKYLIIFCILSNFLYGSILNYDLYKKESSGENTLLVIGGIHGDEPGGYFAPSVLVQNYTIKKGSLWVVPNLNFDSIVRNRRGIYGDMNRKFNKVEKNDEDYETVQNIKKLILDKKVDLILNLHDGRGFYRHKWESSIFNPSAWGQAFIIDQTKLHKDIKFSNLDEIAKKVSENLNTGLVENHHSFNIKNTKTKEKDEQMQLSLTYFAITNHKPAFAVETSKNITDLVKKVKYQLKAIESFMNIMGIEYERDFDLDNLEQLTNILNRYKQVKINDCITLNLETIKSTNYYFPLKNDNNIFKFEHPLGAIVKYKGNYNFMIGNIRVGTLIPQYFEYCDLKESIKILVDKEEKIVNIGDIVEVDKNFEINAPSHFRVNIIGFSKDNLDNENNLQISKKDILDRFAVDKNQKSFRVEFYDNQNKFCGMIIIKFK
jgi:hypothetical protein